MKTDSITVVRRGGFLGFDSVGTVAMNVMNNFPGIIEAYPDPVCDTENEAVISYRHNDSFSKQSLREALFDVYVTIVEPEV